nr:hypothetical protein [Catenibacterium mitsuokai]
MLEINTKAPSFNLPDEEGMIIKAKERVKTADNPKEMLEALS